ncbi:protein MET1, chloroplastic-like isoform X1 [Selaginella moellendorffii]|uniref:protein MET1, chloroplastic-like isoform X1 n=1 Tax=Selaginella moellendorffii TaxID=88036 RepID=UPI000D1C44F8|nr:protein MET1, chloroplastic-like isoform X1 [Selaginella moellendorffii]|eukprot:XP_024528234.1 protein MET1, chloroplastic-like isoform X1 [Selaginella moellendorffii]
MALVNPWPCCSCATRILLARNRGSVHTYPFQFYAGEKTILLPKHKKFILRTSPTNQPQISSSSSEDAPPPGCSRVKVELRKPLGMILEEDAAGNIFVAEVSPGGNAEKSGLVEVGDQLIATSAVVYADQEVYQGVTVRKGMQVVRLNVRGEKFETVRQSLLSLELSPNKLCSTGDRCHWHPSRLHDGCAGAPKMQTEE